MADKWTRLIELREGRNLSQVELARLIGLSRSGLSMYELGQREPDMETVRKLASHFGVSTDYLLGRSGDSQPGTSTGVSPEWVRVIDHCLAMGLEPDQVLRALTGLSIISDALKTDGNKKDREG